MNPQISFLLNKSLESLRNSNLDSAELYLKQALRFESSNPHVLRLLGIVYAQRGEYSDALNYLSNSLRLLPKNSLTLSNLGNVFLSLKEYNNALDAYDKSIKIDSKYEEAWTNKGNALHELKRYDEAIVHHDKALSLKPDYAQAWANKGGTLNFLKRHSEAAKCYRKALDFNAEAPYLLGQAHHQMMLGCDWANYEMNIAEISHLINEGKKGAEPFGTLGIIGSEGLQKKCAEIYSNDKYPALSNLSEASQYKHHKIRIGYLCGEFRNQATSILMTRVWELHDKSKFEIFAFDNGWDDGSEYRQRIAGAFSNIFDI